MVLGRRSGQVPPFSSLQVERPTERWKDQPDLNPEFLG